MAPAHEKFYHELHNQLKPSGLVGHGFGIVGSALLVIGVFGYMARKRMHFLSRLGYLRYWLEFHIFLCSLGPVLILYHTAFKFGGIVAISFWSMAAVVFSGIVGRFIYLQIPRTIEGREMNLNEINKLKDGLEQRLKEYFNMDERISKLIHEAINSTNQVDNKNSFVSVFSGFIKRRATIGTIKKGLKTQGLKKKNYKAIINLVKKEMILNQRIKRLQTMQNLLRYWHVAHLPFALIMLVIMIIHIGIALTFGYKWIF